jgi:hypothetical protein
MYKGNSFHNGKRKALFCYLLKTAYKTSVQVCMYPVSTVFLVQVVKSDVRFQSHSYMLCFGIVIAY